MSFCQYKIWFIVLSKSERWLRPITYRIKNAYNMKDESLE